MAKNDLFTTTIYESVYYTIKPHINSRSHGFVAVFIVSMLVFVCMQWVSVWCWCCFNSILKIIAHTKANIILHLFHIGYTDTAPHVHVSTVVSISLNEIEIQFT